MSFPAKGEKNNSEKFAMEILTAKTKKCSFNYLQSFCIFTVNQMYICKTIDKKRKKRQMETIRL